MLVLAVALATGCAADRLAERSAPSARGDRERGVEETSASVDVDKQFRMPRLAAPLHPRTDEPASAFAALTPPWGWNAEPAVFWAIRADGTLAFAPRAWVPALHPMFQRRIHELDSAAGQKLLLEGVRLEYREVDPSLAQAFIAHASIGLTLFWRHGRSHQTMNPSAADVVLAVRRGVENSIVKTGANIFWRTSALSTDTSSYSQRAAYIQVWRMAMESIWEEAR
ncbi:MAG: hypothetical protein GC161_13170 [Planctomycetaceae bacterium]|nr:hypothetical protein [Planctomycetaceae bacterium]